jgi:hypothetical protein
MAASGAGERMENPFARRRADPPARPAPELVLRPMTGYEEELVEERRHDANTAALCNEIIARCLVPPGADTSAARARVRSLLVAQRDAALVHLRRISLGDVIHSRIHCPACDKPNEIDFRISDLPVSVADAPERIDVPVDGGIQATLRLPTAGDQEDLLDADLESDSQRRTFLLARALVRWGGQEGPFDYEFARGLSIGVRNALEAALVRTTPDLDLSMAVRCSSCGHAWGAPFDVPSFFLPK